MSLFEEHDPRFVHLERKVGIFVILGVAATVSAVALLGVRQGVFTPRAAVYFRVESAEDLGEGADVLTRGFRIGKVSRLRLDDAGKVEVRLAVDKNALKWIKQDSTARLSKGLLVGGAKVVITSGTPGAAVYFRVASAEDLGEGAEVLTRGFRIGKVARLRLDDAGKVEVRLAVDKNALRWIKRDSTARLSKSLLVGGAKVVIGSGTPGAEVIREGDEIAF